MIPDFTTNAQESPEPCKAELKGTLPTWLKGTLLRNGPGIFTVGETSYHHWFDGLSIINSFAFQDGEVIHRSRYLQSDTYKANMAANRIVVSDMGTMATPEPGTNFISKMKVVFNNTVPDFTDNGSHNIIKYGNDYYATTETNYICKIDPVTLETLEKVDYMKLLSLNLAAAHVHYDKEGNTFNFGTALGDKGNTKYALFKVPTASEKAPALKNAEVLSSVISRSLLTPSYYHSFGMTENYFIFIEQPLKIDILKMATAYIRGVTWASCMKFSHDEQTVIHLIDRRTGKEVEMKYYTGAMVVYHHVNAFEDDGHVVFDVIAYDDANLYEMFYMNKLRENVGLSEGHCKPSYRRFVLPIQSDKLSKVGENLVKLKYTTASAMKDKPGKLMCHPEVLYEGLELPRINYDVNGKRHRFVYGCCVETSVLAAKIGKLDTETRQIVCWGEDNCWPSEPVFIPRPNGEAEDDGVILSSVVNCNEGQSSFLLVLDGKTFKEVARAYVKADLRQDMHGIFIPQKN